MNGLPPGVADGRPLFGTRIVVTRASAQAGCLHDALVALGADVVTMPALRIEPLADGALDRALARVAEYDWVVFTSQNAVRITWDAIRARGEGARTFAGRRIACVGHATSDALHAHGITADVVPLRAMAEGVLEAMSVRNDVRARRVLYLAAEGARDALPLGLRALECEVDVATIYRSASDGAGAAALREALNAGSVDAVTFASASAVRGYVEAVGRESARRTPAVSIGPITSAAVIEAGIPLAGEAAEASMAVLVQEVVRVVARRREASA